MSKLGFRKSLELQPITKHLPKTKPKRKTTFFMLEYFLKLIIKNLLMPHTSSNLPHDICWRLKAGGNLVNCHLLHLKLHIQINDMNPTYMPCQSNKTNAQNPMTQLDRPLIAKKKLNITKVWFTIQRDPHHLSITEQQEVNYVNIDSSIISITTICNDSKIHRKGNNNIHVVSDS
jgi:hypothetical protein